MSLNEDFRVKTLIYVQAFLSEQLGSWNQLCEEIQMFVVRVFGNAFQTLVQFSVYFCEHDRRDKIEKSDVKGAICYLERIKPNWAQQIIGPNEPDTFVDVSNVSSDSLDLYGKFKNMLQAVIKVVDVINPAMQFLFDHNSPLCYDDLAANMLRTKMESSLSNSFWKSPGSDMPLLF